MLFLRISLSACVLFSIATTSCHKSSSKSKPQPVGDPTVELISSNEPGSNWIGTCEGAEDAELNLYLGKDLAWSILAVTDLANDVSDIGTYSRDGASLSFQNQQQDRQTMSCYTLRISNTNALRCNFAADSKVAVSRNCAQATFARIEMVAEPGLVAE